ncbi:MAG TPA: bifunctional 23S rRNA (guanine(2069)-N(7))-methyltransferase RlmK/23S rRNA (guanine(2445)-N(2))-methyltransferase RlmL [Steroidobacteraceae bacterium]|nr:bifunctional 23S rRNA (guanine(2069)-N(7))-methyltransferase RlmK/23S rRNA (guanine(2445)-N(2))-methyltransferase RlmL [Steroidobacteraceae bacterium]
MALSASYEWLASAPIGAASVLAEELGVLGAREVRARSVDVRFSGPLELGYRACLWSRTATRVLLSLATVEAGSAQGLLEALTRIDWSVHLAPGATLACSSSGGNAVIRHTIYGAQLLKDAVCDRLRAATGERPTIRPERPDVLLHLHVEGERAFVSVDFSGESLHRRGYRRAAGAAPLKENVAAAILWRAGWPAVLAQGGTLLDPMCGSGTFLTEAALMAGDIAPALGREYFGFLGWRGHDRALWERLLVEARARAAARVPRRCIYGADRDPGAVRAALENTAAAGVAAWVHVERRDLAELAPPRASPGLLVCNPPYGERIGADGDLKALYGELGRVLRERFGGWKAAILSAAPALARELGLQAQRTHPFFNGAIECRLLRFDLASADDPPRPRVDWAARPGAQMFANRVRKNLERLGSWAAREGIDCYRLYDADMPEYAFAIDVYGRIEPHVHLQEYAPPHEVSQEGARERRREVLAVVPQVLGVPLDRMHSRVRRPRRVHDQYERLASSAERHVIEEGGLKFWINFRDYLDTGIFLDHRLVRARLREWAQGADFLNLFCYTATASVYAAAGGARSTLGIDLSNTYLEWARDNLTLNGFAGPEHRLERADCLAWLEAQPREPRFDLIYIDPPTFSNSKRMRGVLDVQRDHVKVLQQAFALLRPEGQILFSTHYERFKLDRAALADRHIEDLSAATLPKDFARNPRMHHCYRLTAAQSKSRSR